MDATDTDIIKVTPGTVVPPAVTGQLVGDPRQVIGRAVAAWLLRTPSPHTRKAYEHDLNQFQAHAGIEAGAFEHLPAIRPEHVAAWRDRLAAGGMTNVSVRDSQGAARGVRAASPTQCCGRASGQ
jgi:Phage integrase, N-terminal SAM-like domain